MRWVLTTILSFCIPTALHAQSLCGQPPVVTNDQTRVSIVGMAHQATKSVGEAFEATLERDKEDIFSKYGESERGVAYYQFVVCQIISADLTLGPEEKVTLLNKAFSALFISNKKRYASYSFLTVNNDSGEKRIIHSTFRRDGSHWIEFQFGRAMFDFSEREENADFIWLVDNSRGVELKIPVQGGKMLFRWSHDRWYELDDVHPIE